MFKRLRGPLTVLVILLILASAVFAQATPIIFKKYISVGGGAYFDGILEPVAVGQTVNYKFEVINPVGSGIYIGEMKIIDSAIGLDTTIHGSLSPGQSNTTGSFAGGNTLLGFRTNTATFSAAAWVYAPAYWVYYSPSDYVYLTDTAGYYGYTYTPTFTFRLIMETAGSMLKRHPDLLLTKALLCSSNSWLLTPATCL
jgi:hypothetical protein